ncbi:MAG: hypothetical protein U0L20_01765 [Ruminococcus sp.]|nr:hypothetical protein [Ruminococcus sp.]
MALCSELSELLSGFEKRMKFINIVRCLLDYKYPDNIRAMLPDKKILDNIIVAVLVFIKDRTLASQQICTQADVERFLEDFSAVLPLEYNIDAKVLSRYIIVEVLQNGGVMNEFLTFYTTTESFQPMSIRLINEEKGGYYLTDDAFDFLFRSKEIESELDYSVTRFKMKEYIRRENYDEALDASRELVSRIRNMKISMDDFLLRCRENISRITVDEYDTIISRIRELLDDESKELREIQTAAKESAKKIGKALYSGIASEETRRHRVALKEIIDNISLTIEEQRILSNKKTSLKDSYHTLLMDNFVINRFERLNFEKDIMIPLRTLGEPLGDAAKILLFMLTKPEFDKKFSLENFYVPQSKINTDVITEGLDITEEDTNTEKEIESRNKRFTSICFSLFRFMVDKNCFKISDFIDSLCLSELKEFSIDKALPNVLLSLFALQELDMVDWNNSEKYTIIPNGEFELSWCLEEIPKEYLEMKKIKFTDLGSIFSFSVRYDDMEYKIDMTDFGVEVIQ